MLVNSAVLHCVCTARVRCFVSCTVLCVLRLICQLQWTFVLFKHTCLTAVRRMPKACNPVLLLGCGAAVWLSMIIICMLLDSYIKQPVSGRRRPRICYHVSGNSACQVHLSKKVQATAAVLFRLNSSPAVCWHSTFDDIQICQEKLLNKCRNRTNACIIPRHAGHVDCLTYAIVCSRKSKRTFMKLYGAQTRGFPCLIHMHSQTNKTKDAR